jgi:hypothetical protein
MLCVHPQQLSPATVAAPVNLLLRRLRQVYDSPQLRHVHYGSVSTELRANANVDGWGKGLILQWVRSLGWHFAFLIDSDLHDCPVIHSLVTLGSTDKSIVSTCRDRDTEPRERDNGQLYCVVRRVLALSEATRRKDFVLWGSATG